MSRRAKVPPSGSAVFQADKDDWRQEVLVPVGGVILRCRFPAATAKPLANSVPFDQVKPEIIYMSQRPYVARTPMADPYRLDEQRAKREAKAKEEAV